MSNNMSSAPQSLLEASAFLLLEMKDRAIKNNFEDLGGKLLCAQSEIDSAIRSIEEAEEDENNSLLGRTASQ